MPGKKIYKKTKISEILGILTSAKEENDKDKEKKFDDVRSGDADPEVSAEEKKYNDSVGEAQKIIDDYDEKKRRRQIKEETKKEVKSSLSAKLEEDRELESYYYGSRKSRMDRAEVREIYSLINSEGPVPEKKEKDGGQAEEDGDTKPYVQESFMENGGNDAAEPDAVSVTGEEKEETDAGSDGQVSFGIADDSDKKLRLAFPMLGEDEDDSEEQINEYKKRKKEAKREKKESRIALEENSVVEFESQSQKDDILNMLKKSVASSLKRLVIVAVLFAGIFYLELSSFDTSRNVFLRPGRYGALYILIDLQLLLFIGITMTGSVRKGLRGIRNGVLRMESLLVLALLCPALHCVYSLAFNRSSPDLRLFCLCGAFSALCCAIVNHLQCRRDLHCFRIVSSEKQKYASNALASNAKEADDFYKYLFDGAEFFTVGRTEFISGFFKRTLKRPKSEDILNLLIPVSLVFAVMAGAMQAVIGGDGITSALNAAALMLAAVIPANAFFMIALPVINANKKGKKRASAFIGNAVTEEYADAGVISFADTEAFPESKIRLTRLEFKKENGAKHIDEFRVVSGLVRIFRYIGSPLRSVMDDMADGYVPDKSSVSLLESTENGICVSMNGREYYLGKRAYMRQYGFDVKRSEEDNEYESKKGNSIMYVAEEDDIICKMYLHYSLNKRFERLLRDMHHAGICVAIKTLDPNIDNSLLLRTVSYTKCPITIIKAVEPEEMTGISKSSDSGIVTLSSLHTFLNMFVMCDRARHATKGNAIINIAGFLL